MDDSLGDRMKEYENTGEQRFSLGLPIIARLDGRSFHNFTRGMVRPFSPVFSNCMISTTKLLVEHTGARIGYTQSDEITLAWYSDSIDSQIWFDRRKAKMISQLAAQATLFFYRAVVENMPEYADRLPSFDARVWTVPSLTEGCNSFLWREWDATKNSITMAASSIFSHRDLHKKTGEAKIAMMLQHGVRWDDYPTHFKRGTYVQRRHVVAPFDSKELESLPPKHEARLNPNLVVARSVVSILELPPLNSISNRESVIFYGEEPITEVVA